MSKLPDLSLAAAVLVALAAAAAVWRRRRPYRWRGLVGPYLGEEVGERVRGFRASATFFPGGPR